MAKKIIITGGSGFIGTHLVQELYKRNYELYIFDIKESTGKEAKYEKMDLRDAELLNTRIKEIQPFAIIHLAGLARGSQKDLYDINVQGTKNILNAFQGKMIFMSTGMVYQGNNPPFEEEMQINPIDEYPKTKRIAEELCMQNVDNVIIRASLVYGPGQEDHMFIPELREAVLVKKQPFKMTKGEQKRDFIHVKDLVKAICILLEEKSSGIFNISSAEQVSIQELIEKAKAIIGDFPVEQSLNYRPNEIWDYSLSNEKAKKYLKWSPTISLEQGLKEILQA